jgi:hypothetical protein
MKVLKYRPLFDTILTTADKNILSSTGIVLATTSGDRQLKSTQTILRVGPNASDYLKPGDVVEIDMGTFPKKMIKKASQDVGPDIYEVIPPLHVAQDGTEFMKMNPRNLLFIIED